MKKFSFSLERILSFKKTMYEKERNELARLRGIRNRLRERKNETLRQMLELDAAFREKATRGVRAEEISSINFHRTNSEQLVNQLQLEIDEMNVLIAKQLEIVIELDRDVKGMEKLREKQWEKYLYEYHKKEQERVLEIVSGRYIEEQNEHAAQDA